MWNVQLCQKNVIYMTVEAKYFLTCINAQPCTNSLQKVYPKHAQETLPGSLTMAERLILITCASSWLTESMEAKHGCVIFFTWQHRNCNRFLALWKQHLKQICGLIEIKVWAGWKETQGGKSGAELLDPVSVLLHVDEVCWVCLLVAQEGHSFAPFQKTRDDCKSWHT